MMTITTEKTVREWAVEVPGAAQALEKLGIDYCCGGGQSLEQACRAAHLPLGEVMAALEAAQAATPAGPLDWQAGPFTGLIAHIQNTHHQYTREELERLGPLFDKVCSVHANNHPELLRLRDIVGGLAQELAMHMMKEERILFPYMVRLEQAAVQNQPAPQAPFGAVENPIAMMMHEHDDAGQALHNLRQLSHGYTAPADACLSFQTLYQRLAALEGDLHQHIHLENNILFPRAAEMERTH